MKCPVRSGGKGEILLDYCARTLDLETVAQLEQHMEKCQDCRAFRDSQSAAWATLDQWEDHPISVDFDRRLYARIRAEERRPWWRQLGRSWSTLTLEPAMPVAVACLALLGAFLFQSALSLPRPASQAALEAPVDPVDPEQLESALEDMLMLRVLPLRTPPAPPLPGPAL